VTDPNALPPKQRRYRRLVTLILGGLAGGVFALAAVYGIGLLQGNAADPACEQSAALAEKLAPLARGEVAAVTVTAQPARLPDLAFSDAAGKPRKLSDWHGRTVLLNLWATWCVPCRKEMPALDALQGKLGSDRFEVVTVNIDTRNPDKPKAWLNEVGIKQLGYYADPSAKVFQDLKAIGKAVGMPTTLLVDAQGCELGVIAGPAEWASDDAVKLVEAALGKS
jgi:thiol-disulfide isomerase/thioredoxin